LPRHDAMQRQSGQTKGGVNKSEMPFAMAHSDRIIETSLALGGGVVFLHSCMVMMLGVVRRREIVRDVRNQISAVSMKAVSVVLAAACW